MKKLFLLLSLSASSMLMAQNNLLNNGGMDNGECCTYVNAAHWTPTSITYQWTEGISYPGSNGYGYGKITPTVGGTLRNYIDGADDAKIYNGVKVDANQAYTVSFWAKSEQTNQVKVNINWHTSQEAAITSTTSEQVEISGDWKQYSVTVTSATDATRAAFTLEFASANGEILLDEVVMEKAQNTTTTTQEDPANIVKYGSFEVLDPDYGRMVGWYTNSVDKEQHSSVPAGTNSQKSFRLWTGSGVYLTSFYQGESNILEVEAEKTYTLTFWTKGAETDKFSVTFRWYTGSQSTDQQVVIAPTNLPSEWTKQTIQVTVPQDTDKAELRISFTGGAGYAYIDDVVMKPAEQNTTTALRPQANPDTAVSTTASGIRINLPATQNVSIHSINGTTVWNTTMPVGTHTIHLPQGIYTVKTGQSVTKVIVR